MIRQPLDGFWVAFLVAAVCAYPIYRALLALKSRQTIDPFAPETHQVKQGTPTMGGLIILAGLIPTLVLSGAETGLLLTCIGFAFIGFVDDFIVPRYLKGKRGLGWKQKIILQVGIATLGAWLTTGLYGNPLWIGIGAFLILFFSNAYNFADGLDALAGSLLLVLGGSLWLYCGSPMLGAALVGATLPFLFLNAPPAKIFMGDVGSLPIGAVLGLTYATALKDSAHWQTFGALFALNFVLILELTLVPIQVGYFKMTKKRLFPATPIHHGFEKKGWPEVKVVWTFFLTQIVCSAIAYTLVVRFWGTR